MRKKIPIKRHKKFLTDSNKYWDGGGIVAQAMKDKMFEDYRMNTFKNAIENEEGIEGNGFSKNYNFDLMGTIASGVDMTGDLVTAISREISGKHIPAARKIGLYNFGGNLGMANDIMGTTAELVKNGISQARLTEDVDSLNRGVLGKTSDVQSDTDSFDALARDYSLSRDLRTVSYKDLRDKSWGEDFGNSLSASAKGFGAGAQAGPIGAIIGGVVGGASSLIGSLVGRSKAKREARKLNKKINFVNDFNNRSLSNRADNLAMAQFSDLESNYSAYGGHIGTHGADFSNGLIYINNGGSHESNPLEGVPIGYSQDGIPNLVEEGETIFNNYVFSNRLTVPKNVRKKYKLGDKKITFAEASKKMAKESEERPNDPISKRGLLDSINKLEQEQEYIRNKRASKKFASGGRLLSGGGPSGIDPYLDVYDSDDAVIYPTGTKIILAPDDNGTSGIIGNGTRGSEVPEWFKNYKDRLDNNLVKLRYAPAIGAGLSVFTDALGLTNKPYYGHADLVGNTPISAPRVSYDPISNYLSYRPFDRDYYINKLNAQSGATRRAILQNAGLNRGAGIAGLLAADYNTQNQLGDLARQAEEYNLAQRERVEAFNRGTNQFNSEMGFKASSENAHARMNADKLLLQARTMQAQMKDAADARASAAKSSNYSDFINSLGDIGREEFSRNMLNYDNSKYYGIDRNGKPFYKAAYNKLSKKEKERVDEALKALGLSKPGSNAYGGYLTISKNRRK